MQLAPENANWIVQALRAPSQIKPAEQELHPTLALQGNVEPPQPQGSDQRPGETAFQRPRRFPLRAALKTALFVLYRPIRPLVRSIMWRSRSFFSQPILEEIAVSRQHLSDAVRSSDQRLMDETRATALRLEQLVQAVIPRLEQLGKELTILRTDMRALASVPHMVMELSADSAVLKRDLAEIAIQNEQRTAS